VSSEKRLERVSGRTYRIVSQPLDAPPPASRFAYKAPDAAKATTPSRFGGWGYNERVPEVKRGTRAT
jgi:hypothetical protein